MNEANLIITIISAVAAIAAAVIAWWAYDLQRSANYPTVTLNIQDTVEAGWWRCRAILRNHFDCTVVIDSIRVTSPRGFLLATTQDGAILESSISSELRLDWHLHPSSSPEPSITKWFLVRPTSLVSRRQPRKQLSMSIKMTVRDATRRTIKVPTKTNAINWTA